MENSVERRADRAALVDASRETAVQLVAPLGVERGVPREAVQQPDVLGCGVVDAPGVRPRGDELQERTRFDLLAQADGDGRRRRAGVYAEHRGVVLLRVGEEAVTFGDGAPLIRDGEDASGIEVAPHELVARLRVEPVEGGERDDGIDWLVRLELL